MEAENFDRLDIRLPGYQEKMLQDVINNGRFVVILGLYLYHAVLGYVHSELINPIEI